MSGERDFRLVFGERVSAVSRATAEEAWEAADTTDARPDLSRVSRVVELVDVPRPERREWVVLGSWSDGRRYVAGDRALNTAADARAWAEAHGGVPARVVLPDQETES